MKDMAHHRNHMHKKIIRDSKKEEINSTSFNHAPLNHQPLQESSMSQNLDTKRKATRDFVRQMNQRDRAH